MTKTRPATARCAVGFAVASLLVLGSGSARANPAGRIYIKSTNILGKVLATWAIDPAGNLFMASSVDYFVVPSGLPSSGLVFKNNGSPLYGIGGVNSNDPTQFGKFSIGYNSIGDQIPQLPTASGSLVFKSNGVARLEMATQAAGGYVAISQLYYDKFGYRKNASGLTPIEKQNFRDAFLWLGTQHYPGTACDARSSSLWIDPGTGQPVPNLHANLPGGVTYWGKFDEIHSDTMTHGGDDFLPWHRELLNRIETQMRLFDPLVSLPYWDWNVSPTYLWTPDYMGVWSNFPCVDDGTGQFVDAFTGAGNCAGTDNGPIDLDPASPTSWSANGFYSPSCDPTCADAMVDVCTSSCVNPCRPMDGAAADAMMNPFFNAGFPVKTVRRNAPRFDGQGIWANAVCSVSSDDELIHNADLLPPVDQFRTFFGALTCPHSYAHDYVGGTMGPPQTSARDPFFFLMHANVDRLWASWQNNSSFTWRKDPNATVANSINGVYGIDWTSSAMESVTFAFEPWADIQATNGTPMYRHIRPYTSQCQPSCPASEQAEAPKNSTAVDVVTPPLYDYLLE